MVDLDAYLSRIGYSGPLALELDLDQTTPHEMRRVVREGSRYFHKIRYGSEWSDVCEFTLEEMPPIDRELANWFTSAHPGSHFKNRPVAARALPDGRRATILNREFGIRERNGHAQKRTLATPQELLEVLREHFGIQFPGETRFVCAALDWPLTLCAYYSCYDTAIQCARNELTSSTETDHSDILFPSSSMISRGRTCR